MAEFYFIFGRKTDLIMGTTILAAGLSPWTVTRRRLTAIVAVFGQLAFHPLQPFGQLVDLLVGLG